MKILISLTLALMFATSQASSTDNAPSVKVAALGKTLDFIADVEKYQGMFDSVVEYCRPYAPAPVLEAARKNWFSKNQRYLDLRDKELAHVIDDARANGATLGKIASIKDWAKQQYQTTFANNRMYKDLAALKDLPIACSRRLGEMNYSGMSLQVIRPSAAEYAASK